MAKSPGSTHLNLACRWEYYIYIVYKESYIYNKISAVRLKKANGFPSVYAIFFHLAELGKDGSSEHIRGKGRFSHTLATTDIYTIKRLHSAHAG